MYSRKQTFENGKLILIPIIYASKILAKLLYLNFCSITSNEKGPWEGVHEKWQIFSLDQGLWQPTWPEIWASGSVC